jgi:predicted alpha/beta-fold hydrolase
MLDQIKRPMFFLSALDDPFFGAEVIPTELKWDNILVGVTTIGAHCTWVEGEFLPRDLWWSKPCLEFL